MGFALTPRTGEASEGFSMWLLWDVRGMFLTLGWVLVFLEGKFVSP